MYIIQIDLLGFHIGIELLSMLFQFLSIQNLKPNYFHFDFKINYHNYLVFQINSAGN